MSDTLKITLLGTGIPNPDMNAFGTSTLIEAGDEVVVDALELREVDRPERTGEAAEGALVHRGAVEAGKTKCGALI